MHTIGTAFVYASSAATYGGGEHGYSDAHDGVAKLKPLNPYGDSKQDFDLWALSEADAGRAPYFWAGLKFFNVYGPGIPQGPNGLSGHARLPSNRRDGWHETLRSHREDYADGEQLRDFVYVRTWWMCATG